MVLFDNGQALFPLSFWTALPKFSVSVFGVGFNKVHFSELVSLPLARSIFCDADDFTDFQDFS